MKNKSKLKLKLRGAKTIDELLCRSDINCLLECLSKRRTEYYGIIAVCVTHDGLIDVSSTSSLSIIETLGGLQSAILKVSDADYEEMDGEV